MALHMQQLLLLLLQDYDKCFSDKDETLLLLRRTGKQSEPFLLVLPAGARPNPDLSPALCRRDRGS